VGLWEKSYRGSSGPAIPKLTFSSHRLPLEARCPDDGRLILSPQRFAEDGPEGLRLHRMPGGCCNFAERCVALRNARTKHNIEHEILCRWRQRA
jgi:hypothetical protein